MSGSCCPSCSKDIGIVAIMKTTPYLIKCKHCKTVLSYDVPQKILLSYNIPVLIVVFIIVCSLGTYYPMPWYVAVFLIYLLMVPSTLVSSLFLRRKYILKVQENLEEERRKNRLGFMVPLFLFMVLLAILSFQALVK